MFLPLLCRNDVANNYSTWYYRKVVCFRTTTWCKFHIFLIKIKKQISYRSQLKLHYYCAYLAPLSRKPDDGFQIEIACDGTMQETKSKFDMTLIIHISSVTFWQLSNWIWNVLDVNLLVIQSKYAARTKKSFYYWYTNLLYVVVLFWFSNLYLLRIGFLLKISGKDILILE